MPRSSQKPIIALHRGTNANLLADAARLHIPDGALVADVTWGHGVFWQKTDQTRFTLLGSDKDLEVIRAASPTQSERQQIALLTCPAPTLLVADCTALPYRDQCLDVVVLDPPYMHFASKWIRNNFYNNVTTKGMNHQAILRERYCRGMMEAARVLRPGGRLLVKGKDEVEGRLRSSFLEIYRAGERCGFTFQHQFLFESQSGPGHYNPPGHTQHHPKLNYSHLLCFVLTDPPFRLVRGRPRKGSASTTLKGQRGKGYLRARLVREYPAIYAQYMAGEVATIHAAAKQAGLVKGR